MTLILAADGKSLLDKRTLPLSAVQLRWFLQADDLLQNVAHLWTLDLKLFCLRCWKKGLPDQVKVRWNDTQGLYWVTCQCAQAEARLPRAEIQRMEAGELLQRLGWSFACIGRCSKERGFADGVEADNGATDGTWSVRCGCTDRVYVVPQTAVGVV